MNHPLKSFEILEQCWKGFVPVNTELPAAVEAHRWAFEQWLKTRKTSDRLLANLTLHVVTFVELSAIEDAQATLDYLATLPADAWPEHPEQTAAAFRESTLANFRQIIG